MSHKIYAPNVHLFAFHSVNHGSLHASRTSSLVDVENLWKKCNILFTKFKIERELNIRQGADGLRVALLEGATENVIFLPLEGTILHNEEFHRITGCACPLKIEDSYALALNLRIPEFHENGQRTSEVDVSVFNDFNPDNCFLPQEIQSSLGQSIFLTAWLSPTQHPNQRLWREIADECVQNFLGQSLDNCPPLYQSGQLFGSPIFEYANPYQPHIYGQIFVWLFVREAFNGQVNSKLDNNFGFFYQKLIDLLLYRQKLIKTYQYSLDVSTAIYQSNQTIKEIIQEINEPPKESNSLSETILHQHLTDGEMNYFKNQLRILPKLDLEYAYGKQALEKCRLEFDANVKQYTEKTLQIQERLPNYDLSFFLVFNQKICSKFQDGINTQLNDCVPSSSLVEKAIASIRGIVEIDKAQRDRRLEETLRTNEIAAQEREKKLQIWLALVVTCLAFSSIVSQISSPVRTVLNYLNSEPSTASPVAKFAQFFFYNFYDILVQTLVGLVVALLLGVMVWLIPHRLQATHPSKSNSSGNSQQDVS
jgi:hypothetical protein